MMIRLSPTTTILCLSDSSKLRLRQPGHNTSGSILLRTPEGGSWDCFQAKEKTVVRYTQQDWLSKCTEPYMTEEEIKQIEHDNDDETRYVYKRDYLRRPTAECININHCKLLSAATGPLTVLHSEWDDGALELFVSSDVDESKHSVARTEYTSLLLSFELVVFGDEEGLKRRRAP